MRIHPFRYGTLAALVLLAAAAMRAQADAGMQSGSAGGSSTAVATATGSPKLINVDANGKEKLVESPAVIVRRGYLGVELTELTPELRTHFGAPSDAGVMVARVVPDSPADRAGLKVGDILTALDGKPVASSWDVRARVRPMEEGAMLPLEVRRDGTARAARSTTPRS
jgi:predicted metalloprotease with PDZ domain